MQALIFDLDGTLVDTVYAHVHAWQRALLEIDLPVDGWRIHRRSTTFMRKHGGFDSGIQHDPLAEGAQ